MQVHIDSNPASAVEINGGGLTGSLGSTTGAGLSFTSNGNNYISGATVDGTLTFPSGGYAQVYNAISLNGSIAIATTSNGIQLHDGNASLNIAATGSLHGYGNIYQVYGGTTISNAGTIAADTPGQTLAFYNDVFTNLGTVRVDAGASMYVQTSLVQSGGLTTVNGTLTDVNPLVIDGGTLDGSGTVDALVNNIAGIVSPGNSPGLLTINGSYTQGGSGGLEIELGGYAVGTQFDHKTVDEINVERAVKIGGI